MKPGRHLAAGVALLCCCVPAFSQPRPKTLAVIDFENANKDKALDWLGTGTAETLITELSQVRQVRLVERRRLHDALKELKFGRSEAVDTATAQKLGKILGAEYVVVGAYQKVEDNLRLTARLMEVETARVLAPALVDGKYGDALKLQTQVAEKLAKEIRGAFATAEDTPLELPTANLEAHKQFSDGAYYFREGLLQEALASLDGALAADPRYSQAHFYKGLALQKLGRWEDAVHSFKQALLGARTVTREKWAWEVPFEKPGSKRGVLPIIPVGEFIKMLRGEEDTVQMPAVHRVIYAERVDKDSVLHLVDPQRRGIKRMVLPNFNALETVGVIGTERIALFLTFRAEPTLLNSRLDILALDIDEGRLAWTSYIEGAIFPLSWEVTSNTLYLHFKAGSMFVALDLLSGTTIWRKKESEVRDLLGFSVFEDVGDLGEVLALQYSRPGGLAIARGRDGGELWRVKGESAEWTAKQMGDTILLLDPKMKMVTAYRAKSGEKKFEVSVPVERKRVMDLPGRSETMNSGVKDNILYAAGKDNTVYAVAVGDKWTKPERVLWKAQLSESVEAVWPWQDKVFVAVKKGIGFILDRPTGKVTVQMKGSSSGPVAPLFISSNFGVGSAGGRVFGQDLQTGEIKWELPTWREISPAIYLDGMVVFQSGKREVSALEAKTGEVRWRHISEKSPVVIQGKGSVFVADSKGVSEYISPRSTDDVGLDKAEVLTQIAVSLLELGQTEEAAAHAQRVVRDLDPDYPEAHFALARIAQRRGEPGKALRELIAYHQLLGPASRRAEEILREFKQNFNLLWRADTEEAQGMLSEELGGTLLLVGRESWFYGVDRSTGRFIWRQRAPHLLDWAVSVLSKDLYFVSRVSEGNDALKIWAMDIPSGRMRLFADMPAAFKVSGAVVRPSGEYVFLELEGDAEAANRLDERLYCLERSTGNLLWQQRRELEAGASTRLSDAGTVHGAYAVKNNLHIFSLADGKEIAQQTESAPIFSASSAALPGRVLYAVGNRRVVSYDVSARQVSWALDLPEGEYFIGVSPLRIRGSLFYFHSSREVLAVNVSDANSSPERIRWRYAVPEGTQLRGIRLAGQRVYALRDDEVLMALDAETGKLVAEHPLLWDAEAFAVKDDIFYAVSADRHAYAMKLAPLATPAPPKSAP